MPYSQLNTLTCYQFGQSTLTPSSYCKRAKQLGYEGVGFCDRTLFSFPSFTDACLKEGLKPIYGLRIRIKSERTHPLDACLYVESEEGYQNLCTLYQNRKELYDWEDLKDITQGLSLVMDTEHQDYKDNEFLSLVSPLLFHLNRTFKDHFYLGIVITSKEDKENIAVLYDYAQMASYPTIAFPKASYVRKSDAYKTHLLSYGIIWSHLSKEERDAIGEIPKEGPYFLLSEKAIQSLYRQEDLDHLSQLVSSIDFEFFRKRGHLIHFGDDEKTLIDKTTSALRRLYPETIPEAYEKRLEKELSVINSMNFASYFLLVADYVNFARNNGIMVAPGRGSAAGSLVSYLLGITELDPLRYGLSFERFLNPMRKSMPDIDVDIEDERRSEVVDYLKKKYGEKRVSTIVTFSTLKPKSALGMIGPVLGVNEAKLKKLTSAIDDNCSDFKSALESRMGYRLKKMLEDPYYQEICSLAEGLLTIPVTTSIHAPGLIISEENISAAVPMSEKDKGTAQYEFAYMERLGYLKCDLLSAKGLSFLKRVEKDIDTPLDDIQNHLDDKETYDVLNSLALTNIYQLSSPGMRETVQIMHPTCFNDLASILALYRPGPKEYIPVYGRRKAGEEEVTYKSELLRPVLQDTYGIMVYQEQVMQALKAVAGFSSADADYFRNAISKKKKEVMETYKEKFLVGCKNNGLSKELSESIYEDIERFSDYGFNKSHAYSYALVAFRFLYDKAHYPKAFYREALEETSLNTNVFLSLAGEMKERNLTIAPLNLNESLADVTRFADNKAYLALSRANSTDRKILDHIVQEREKNGKYRNPYDFLLRNKDILTDDILRTLNSLIDAGAFDSLCSRRKALKSILPTYLLYARMGFDESDINDIPDEKEDLGERLINERSVLGIILSEHLSQIARKSGYKTLIVSDDSARELHGIVKAISETKEYSLSVPAGEEIHKGDFVLVMGDFSRFSRIYQSTRINLGKKER